MSLTYYKPKSKRLKLTRLPILNKKEIRVIKLIISVRYPSYVKVWWGAECHLGSFPIILLGCDTVAPS